jgi:pimeloyl-ACP methyl ester carboxylesterase
MKKALRVIGSVLVVILLVLLVGPFLMPIPPLTDTQSPEALADPDSRFVRINGVNIHYKIAGQGEPAIILLHGFGASTFSWREVLQPLSRLGTVVAYDRPAFGLTERLLPGQWTGENPYSPAAQVDLLFGLMDELGIQKAILVGNSAGGTVAISAALAKPERVQALVLVDAAVYTTGGSSPLLRALFQLPQMDRIGPLFVRSISVRGMEILNMAWHDPSRITDEIKAGYRKPLMADHWDVGLWQMTKTSRSSDLAVRLADIQPPVLVVTGDDDRIVPTENSLRLAKDIPGAQLVVFKNCGHVPQEECPQDFLQAVEPYIQSNTNLSR